MEKTRLELLENWKDYTDRIRFHLGDSTKVLKNLNLIGEFCIFRCLHNKKKL